MPELRGWVCNCASRPYTTLGREIKRTCMHVPQYVALGEGDWKEET